MNAFDLFKVYGAGWMGEAGLAFGTNSPFLPKGKVFDEIKSMSEKDSSPQLISLLDIHKRTMKRGTGGKKSPYDLVLEAIRT